MRRCSRALACRATRPRSTSAPAGRPARALLRPGLVRFVLGLAALAPGLGCSDALDRRAVVSRNLYDRYCSECHGTSDSGPTPVPGLGFEAADLRRLAERYGEPLPREQLADYIDGRHRLATGEARLMPVWGDRLYPQLPDSVEVDEMRAGAIELLIDYLESIQPQP